MPSTTRIDPLSHLVAGQSLADYPADHLLAAAGTVEDILSTSRATTRP
jgi:hypothetical protein